MPITTTTIRMNNVEMKNKIVGINVYNMETDCVSVWVCVFEMKKVIETWRRKFSTHSNLSISEISIQLIARVSVHFLNSGRSFDRSIKSVVKGNRTDSCGCKVHSTPFIIKYHFRCLCHFLLPHPLSISCMCEILFSGFFFSHFCSLHSLPFATFCRSI